MAVASIEKRDSLLARKVIEKGEEIDEREVAIEDECLQLIALYQPVSLDLRFIATVFKVNGDLERIGDLAENIAERSIFLAAYKDITIPFDLATMTEKTLSMLKNSLHALINRDSNLARDVCASDDVVDDINRQMYKKIQDCVRRHPGDFECMIHLMGISRNLERIADLATNIAEDAIYLCEGDIVRHKIEVSSLNSEKRFKKET